MASDVPKNGSGARSSGMARALAAPVRAVGRVLPKPMNRHPTSGVVRPQGSAVVDCGLYVDGIRQSGRVGYAEAFAHAREHGNAFVWLGLHAPTEEEFADIALTFNLHPLAV